MSSLAATLPTFVALDTVGGTTYLYVSEHGSVPAGGAITADGGRILKYNLTSGSTTPTVIATHGTADGQFISPDAIAVDPGSHNLFIADRYLDRVQEITNTGTFVRKFGSSTVGAADEMHGPVGVAIDGSGAIYVTEHGSTNASTVTAGNMVSKFTISGSTVTRVWRKGNGLNVPYSISAAGSNLYISDGFNNQVQVWDLNGNPTGSFGVPAIALGNSIDGAGNFWIGVAGGDFSAPQQILKYNASTGASLLTYGTAGSGNGQFALPFDVAVNTASNLAYVADYHNNRVQVINLAASSGGVPTINSSATASGTVGVNFTYNVTATNSPTSYATVDALPAGLTLNTSTGAITGIPSAAGTTTTHLTATNASGTSAQFALTTTIAAASSGGTPALPLGPTVTHFDLVPSTVVQGVSAEWEIVFDSAVTGVDATDFVVNTQGSATASITGVNAVNTTTYRVLMNYTDSNGSIQVAIRTSGTGITNASSQAFRGAGHTATPVYGTGTTPAADTGRPQVNSVTAGAVTGLNSSFTVTFSEAVTGVDAADFIITGTSATIGTVTGSGTTYTVPITASGSGTVTLTVVGGATSNIRDAATNILGGAGTTSATATFAGGSSPSAPVISSATSASATVGTAFTYNITASGSPTSYAATGLAGTGLSVNTTTGVISGTPTAAGTITSQLTATNSTGTSAPVTLTITVTAAGSAPTVTSAATANATVGTAFSYTITASGSPTSFGATGLAGTGLSLNATTGVISGNPTAAGTITSQLTATNATGTSAPKTLTITVSAAGAAPVVTSSTTASAVVGTAFSYQITASGSPTSFAATGLAGTGLSLNATTGLISGTPTAAGTINSQLTATNSVGTSAPVTLAITVSPASTGTAPVVTSSTTASAVVGTAFSYQITASGSPTSFAATGLAGTGLSLNATTGVISGTPTAAGTITSQLTATNSVGTSAAKTLTITVSSTVPSTPTVTSAATAFGTVGTAFSYQITATGSPTSYAATGLSGGLSLNATSGLISGTPTSSGTFTVQLTATNSAGTSAAKTLTLTISPATPPPPPPPPPPQSQTISGLISPVSSIFVGQSIALNATASSGLPVTYSVVSGNGLISGNTLTFTGAGAVVVRASQAGNSSWAPATAQATFTAEKQSQLIVVGSAAGGTVAAEVPVKLTATSSSGLPVTYTVVSGPATIENGTLTFTGIGTVVVRASQSGNGAYNSTDTTMTFVSDPVDRIVNISSRLRVTNNGASIAGFVVTGSSPKTMLIRAVGPTLSAFGITDGLSDPKLTLRDSAGAVVATNAGWNNDAQVKAAGDNLGAFGLTAGSKDAAILKELAPGVYTVQVESNNTGVVLIEVYDVAATAAVPTKQLVNISTRGYVGTGADALVGGFVVSGNEAKRVLVRAVGPTLASFGVSGTLADPSVKIYNARGEVVAENDNWSSSASAATEVAAAGKAAGAFPLAASSTDAALVLTLAPGQYTAVVSGANNSTGTALVEIYEITNL